MSELEDKISEVLGDPEQMAQITAATATAARGCAPALEMWRYRSLETGRGTLSLRC